MTQHISDDIVRKIKQIEIYTKRLLRSSLVGDSRSAIKGTGFEFDQIREYQLGDDVRFIDWNSSARMNKLLVKQYIEERSRTVLLAVDISSSSFFGSAAALKHDIMAQVASVLALVSDCGKDRVGLLLFSDEVEHYIPPGRGKFHVRMLMEHLFGYKPKRAQTRIAAAFEHLAQLKRKDAMAFIISDFIDDKLENPYLPLLARSYDLVAIRCLDTNEMHLPAIGFLTVEDCETDERMVLDMRKHNKKIMHKFFENRLLEQNRLFKKYGIGLLDVSPARPFIGDIIRFFRRRMRY